LKNINDQRHKARLEKESKENAKEVFEEERVRSTKVLNDDRPRRKFQGFGYSEPPTIEVKVPRSHKPLTFKNKIEEYLWRSKNN